MARRKRAHGPKKQHARRESRRAASSLPAAAAAVAAPADAASAPAAEFVVYHGPDAELSWGFDADIGPALRMAGICLFFLLFLMAMMIGMIWMMEAGTGTV
jgi:hypothetical protein